MDMRARAREALEREAAVWPLWQRRLALGLRWPVRLIYALCFVVVLLDAVMRIPINGAILLPAKVGMVALSLWFAAAALVRALHLSSVVPEPMPRWLKRIMRACLFPVRWGLALAAPLAELVPLVFVFPSVRGTTIAEVVAALICVGIAIGAGPMLMVIAGVVLALPIIIPIGIVRSIRNRRDRRYREIYRYLGHPPW